MFLKCLHYFYLFLPDCNYNNKYILTNVTLIKFYFYYSWFTKAGSRQILIKNLFSLKTFSNRKNFGTEKEGLEAIRQNNGTVINKISVNTLQLKYRCQ